MTNPPNSENKTDFRNNRRLWFLLLSRGGIALAVFAVLALTGGFFWLQNFIRKDLVPLAENGLTTSFKRPVNLGRVKDFSTTGIIFGASTMPPTATDPDKLTVDAVEVGFDIWQFIWTRRLKLNLNLINPDVYVEQNQAGRWVDVTPPKPGNQTAVKIDVNNIRITNGKLTLIPKLIPKSIPKLASNAGANLNKLSPQLSTQNPENLNPASSSPSISSNASNTVKNPDKNLAPISPPLLPISASRVDGVVQIFNNNQQIKYNISGIIGTGGDIKIEGETLPQKLDTKLYLRGNNLLASEISKIMPLPVELKAGRVDAETNIRVQPQQTPEVSGAAIIREGIVQVPKMPLPFTKAQGSIRFQATGVELEKVAAFYGKIPLLATGSIFKDKGYKLLAQVPGVTIPNFQDTLKIKSPFPVTGAMKADLQLTGEVTNPILRGKAVSIKPTRVDKVDFEKIGAQFEFTPTTALIAIKDIQGKAKLGGDITGGGVIRLGTNPQLNFNYSAKNVPADVYAKVYDSNPAFNLGTVSGTGNLSGSPTAVQTSVKFLAPEAKYPATGEIIIAPDKSIAFRNVGVNLAGGNVKVDGKMVNQRWIAIANLQQVSLEPFVDPKQLENVSLKGSQLNGRVALSGNAAPFSVDNIKSDGALANIAGGTVSLSNVQFQDNNFAAQFTANGVRLAQLLKNPLPPALQSPLVGKFQIMGSKDNISLKTIQGIGEAIIPVGAGTVTAKNIKLANGIYQAQVVASNAPLKNLASVPTNVEGNLNGQFLVAGNVDSFKPEAIKAVGQGSLNLNGGGTVNASNLEYNGGRYRAILTANKLPIQRFANIPQQYQGDLTGNFIVAGGIDSFKPEAIQAVGKGRLDMVGGSITATNLQLNNGRYQAQLVANNLPLKRFANNLPPQFQGNLTGNFLVGGEVNSFKPEAIQAKGQGRLDISGGSITANSLQLGGGRYRADLVASNLPLKSLTSNIPPQFQGNLTGNFLVGGEINSFKPEAIQAKGQGRLDIAGGSITANSLQLGGGRYRADLVAKSLPLKRFTNNLPPQFQGNLTGNFLVGGEVNSFKPEAIQAKGQGRLDIAGGSIIASNLQLDGGSYAAELITKNLPLQSVVKLPQQFQGSLGKANLTSQFTVAGALDALKPEAITAKGEGKLSIGDGFITASNFEITKGNYQGKLEVNNLPLKGLASVPPQIQSGLTGNFDIAGKLGSLNPENIQLTGDGKIAIASGNVTASNIQLENGNYQANVDVSQINLKQINPELRGLFDGKLAVAGKLSALNATGITATGDVKFSEGIALIDKPLDAKVAWNGKKLDIKEAVAPGLNANGYILTSTQGGAIPEITDLNLNVQAKDLNLQQLKLQLPTQLAVAGKVDYTGQVTGKLSLPNLNGQITLRDLKINQFAFEPELNGVFKSISGQGLDLNIKGKNDQLAFNIDNTNNNNIPKSFLVKWQQALVSGKTVGDKFAITTQDFPLEIFNVTLKPDMPLGPGVIKGLASIDVAINKNTYFPESGYIKINQPEVGRIKGDSLFTQFNYGKNGLQLTTSEFVKGKSRYILNGNFNLIGLKPEFQGALKVQEGEIQDVLTALQIFELNDFRPGWKQDNQGNFSDLRTTPVGDNSTNTFANSLSAKLQRLAEVQQLLVQDEAKRRAASPLPYLQDLKGAFSGDVTFNNKNGLEADFNLKGENFAWGKPGEFGRFYNADQIIVQGRFENNNLRLTPLEITSKNRQISFKGNLGLTNNDVAGSEQSGQLNITNFPIEALSNFVTLPISLTGNLNAQANISGSLENLQAIGNLGLKDGTFSQNGLQSADASFSYAGGVLNLYSEVKVANAESVKISGAIPYKLPTATQEPVKNKIELDIKIKDKGLAVLNVLTDQVRYEDGNADVDLKIGGTMSQPEVDGKIIVENGVFSTQSLPEKITNVKGKINFGIDRATITEPLQGKFSRGNVLVEGGIALNDKADSNQSLNIKLDQLAINLKGLYQGGASGNLNIGGYLTNPLVGGKIQLNNGQVLLSESSNNNTSREPNNPESNTTTPNSESNFAKQLNIDNSENAVDSKTVTRFRDLEIELGKKLYVTRPPIIKFRAIGKLNITGSLNALQPKGEVKLKEGGVNLYTTQFTLSPGYPQTASFDGKTGLDPNLDIRLIAKVLASIQSVDLNKRPGSDDEFGLAALESIRIEANVKGPASKLNENLELKSNPSKTQPEIVALLGGGFVETQGRGDTTLGLINIAGSAIFGNFNEAFKEVGTAFGLSELRVFPTVIGDPKAGRDSTLQLAAEAGVDISPRFSFSALKILTTNDAVQWGINYRINNDFRLRSSTNLFGDDRAVVEFERRF
jgi:translocation and assembly module TamB